MIDEMSIKDKKNKQALKYVIGYMPQSFCLYNDLTVKENLEYLVSIYKMNVDIQKIIQFV